MKVLKHWFEKPWDNKRSVGQFIAESLVNGVKPSSIVEQLEKKCSDFNSEEWTEEDLWEFVKVTEF